MPAGNPMGYLQRGKNAFGRAVSGARAGKAKSMNVAAGAPPAKSTLNSARAQKMAKYVTSHPYKSTAMGAMGLGAASFIGGRSRRGPGASKTMGRPTGPYKY